MNYLSYNYFHNKNHGFSLVEILITFSLIALAAGLSTPRISKFAKAYRLRIAVSDLTSLLHKSKSISAKQNVEVTLDFNPYDFTGYVVKDSQNHIIARVGFDNCNNPEIKFTKCYHGNVIFKSPHTVPKTHPGRLTIKSNGLSESGYVYITNREETRYYRVGIISASGLVGAERWTGSKWE